MKSDNLTAARLRELLLYEPDTGVFTWRTAVGKTRAGDIAGGDNGRGYRVVGIDGWCISRTILLGFI